MNIKILKFIDVTQVKKKTKLMQKMKSNGYDKSSQAYSCWKWK